MAQLLSFAEVKQKIKESNDIYAIAIISQIDVMRNETFVRSRLAKLLLQIQDFLRKNNVHKKIAILPEDDIHFYSTVFGAAGFDTYLKARFYDDDDLTDYRFISPDESTDVEIYNVCSLVVHLLNPDDEVDNNDLEEKLENENIVYIEVKNPDIEKEIEGGNPSHLLNTLYKKKNLNVKDPYKFSPDYEETLYVRVPLKHFEELLENMPTVGDDGSRFLSTSSVKPTEKKK